MTQSVTLISPLQMQLLFASVGNAIWRSDSGNLELYLGHAKTELPSQ